MADLKMQLLGDLKVFRGEQELGLPPSKKTRALLAYLALNNRKFRREQLCELLWEVPDDPRGSLRWSLSKIRRRHASLMTLTVTIEKGKPAFSAAQ